MKSFTTKVGTVTQREDGITYIKYTEGKVNLEDFKEHMQIMNQELEIKKRLLLVDGRGIKSAASKEVREYLSHDDIVSVTHATAALVGSGIARIAGNLILSFAKPPYPLQLFSNEEKAIQWLQHQGEALKKGQR